VALIRGCHVIGLGSSDSPDWIAREIIGRGLMIGAAKNGTAVWAYFIDKVPLYWHNYPMVIFDVDEKYVVKINIPLPKKNDYAIMKMPGALFDYIPVSVRGFMNLLGLPRYPQTIGFF
jgi:hypothetical protein